MMRLLALVAVVACALAWLAPPAAPSSVRVSTQSSVGSGVLVGPRLALTAQHVVGAARVVRVTGSTGGRVVADVLWTDETRDVALLRLRSDLPGSSEARLSCRRLRQGEPVTTLGNPMSFTFVRSWGRVASASASQPTLLDMTVAPGNSGGPVYDESGEVVGLVRALMAEPTGDKTPPFLFPFTIIVDAPTLCAVLREHGVK